MFQILIAATLVVAVADWVAVATDNRRAEYVLKPATMVVLIGRRARHVARPTRRRPAGGWSAPWWPRWSGTCS